LSNRKLTALVLLSLALCATSTAVALANTSAPHRDAHAAIAALTVASLLGVGLYAWWRGGQGRFGKVLFATGLCWFLASLSNSDADLLYSVGRVAGWVFEVLLVYALLSYPTGRLETRSTRLVVVAWTLLLVALYLPTVPLSDQYPLPTPFTSCIAECPGNSFFAGSEPDFIATVVKPLREVLTTLLYIAAVALLSVRLRNAGHNLRRTLMPVLGAAVLRFATASIYVALRRAEVDTDVLYVASLVALLSVPATALGFFVGLLQWRVYSGTALANLNTGLAGVTDPADLRSLLARSLEEPAVELYYTQGGTGGNGRRWLDSSGHEHAAPEVTAERCLAEAEAESGLRVGIVCERGFRGYPEFLQAVTSCTISGLERQRLDIALAASMEDVEASRKRLASAADSARRKIERDLHDGAQQRLVALRVKLGLAREALDRDPGDAAEMVDDLGPEVDEIIEEVRSLAHGIYPPLLASGGLGEALRAAGRRSALPVTTMAEGVGRFAPETESAVYFCCMEAMQNAAKHATGASCISVELRLDGDLLFEVRDDGCGFDSQPSGEGAGITGMRDRLAAVGGEMRIESRSGGGTRILGRVSVREAGVMLEPSASSR
jgi:signal transduction histidine kinase